MTNTHCPTCRVSIIPTTTQKCPWCDHEFERESLVIPVTDPLIEIPALIAARVIGLEAA